MEISPVGTELFLAEGRTDRRTERQTDLTKLTVAFRNFAKPPVSTPSNWMNISHTNDLEAHRAATEKTQQVNEHFSLMWLLSTWAWSLHGDYINLSVVHRNGSSCSSQALSEAVEVGEGCTNPASQVAVATQSDAKYLWILSTELVPCHRAGGF